ncbi:MAG: LamG domain-containing protein [Phycisphaerae bacterium]|nr:LamG domain-containing protein [Phycisphaerae bacterium]
MWRTLVCRASFVAVLSLVLASGAEAADPNLAGWWPLNEGIGETVVDMSGNGVDGTIHNAANGLGTDGSVWVEDADLGAVISFDGTASGAYVRAGSIPQMTLENDFTWAFWAKQAPGNGSNDIILGNRMDENAVDFVPRQFIKFTPTKFEWHMNGNGDDNMEYEDIPNDVWLHHVVVKTADQLTYYRNGMVAGTGTITQALDFPQPLYFGGDNEGAEGENWAGFISDVRTYDGALSQEQVQAVMGGPAPATLAAWEDAAMAGKPGFFATNVEDGLYDIGVFGGEMTYEFLVRSNPDEEQASMCLIGRRDFGDTEMGLKYEQWNNTGTYGATAFGVADYDFGVATNPGLFTHLVFVASAEAGTTDLYVNGAYKGSVAAAITLSGLVGIGYGAQDREGADPFFDDFDGEIFGVAIYDRALSKGEIRVNADTYLEKGPSDITAAGDAVQGVPNDGDWPGAETPDLAIDDNVATKYLHFKGETEPTGFQVTPALGATVVTGLTLTTANDAVERDPIAFELYGSNESIDGPYALIASGEVADFNQVDAWPRFTMNATSIAFENVVAYQHYQILFPAVRDPASANSMQIAEVELIGVPCLPRYTYDGGALDDQWEHDNGSDAWDGTGPGEGGPGGIAAIVEEDVTFLRVQDTGDPRDYGMPDPSNRKIYLTHPVCASLDGAHLEVAVRVATGAGLDDLHPDGGAETSPWPEAGIGYHIRDNGKGMIGVSDGSQVISFSLAKAGEIAGLETDALVMNNLVGTEPSGDVDTGDAGVANVLAIADATAWNSIVIDIVAGGAGTHVVTVSVNGEAAQSFEVTAGTGTEKDYGYIAFGSSGTGAVTAFDVDYLSVTN